MAGRASRGPRKADLSARLRAILDASVAAMLVLRLRDGRFVVVDANEAAAIFFGATRDELARSTLAADVLGPVENELLAVAAGGSPRDFDARLAHARLRGGDAVHVRGRVVRLDDGVAVGLVDLTERDALHGRVALDDRLASLGRLAAGVAHEFNNPLAWVIGSLEHIRDKLAAREYDDVSATIDEALEGTSRLQRIVGDLRSTATPSPPDPGGIDVGPTIDAAVRMAAHAVQRRGRLHLDVAPDLPRVVADSSALTQVLLNLLLNAANALPGPEVGGGSLRVTAERSGAEVVVRVADDGCGIADHDLARVFEPFFTTRAAGGGTGLGLWIARSIVTSFGGRLELRSVLREGTTVDVALRIAEPAPRRAKSKRPLGSAPPPAPLRILVVDDEPLVARTVARALRGHTTQVETRPDRALDRIRGGERFDLMITDLTMPGLDGFELLLTAEMLDEGLNDRVIVMSGGTSVEVWQALQERGIHTIEKPFEGRHLRALVARFGPR